MQWQKVGEQVVYERFRRIVSRTFELPDGQRADFEVLDEYDTVAVLALTDDERIVLVREFRAGPEEILLELPAGQIEDGEQPDEAAQRELLEESGYEGALALVGTIVADAYSTRTKYAFAATRCRRTGPPAEGELTEPVLMRLAEFREHLRGGRLTDSEVAYRALDFLGLL